MKFWNCKWKNDRYYENKMDRSWEGKQNEDKKVPWIMNKIYIYIYIYIYTHTYTGHISNDRV